jgi:hypothetical protein
MAVYKRTARQGNIQPKSNLIQFYVMAATRYTRDTHQNKNESTAAACRVKCPISGL